MSKMKAIYTDCVAENYENLAQSWASHIDKPFANNPNDVERDIQIINALWRDVYMETLEFIQSDPFSFADKVSLYRMANRMPKEGQ